MSKQYTAREQAIIDNYRNRFNSERYREAIEWLALEDFERDIFLEGDIEQAAAAEEGATMTIAHIFDQSYNTVFNDAWYFAKYGEHKKN